MTDNNEVVTMGKHFVATFF